MRGPIRAAITVIVLGVTVAAPAAEAQSRASWMIEYSAAAPGIYGPGMRSGYLIRQELELTLEAGVWEMDVQCMDFGRCGDEAWAVAAGVGRRFGHAGRNALFLRSAIGIGGVSDESTGLYLVGASGAEVGLFGPLAASAELRANGLVQEWLGVGGAAGLKLKLPW